MNTEIANALSGYFDTLFALNRNLITFCGMEAYADDPWKLHKYMQAVICFLPQLIPYSFSRNTRQYCISLNDGLMEFSDSLPFLRQDYEAILQKHYAFLVKIKELRNKYEHKMHAVDLTSAGSGSFMLFDLCYHVNGQKITISAGNLIAVVKDLNILFSKIQQEVRQFAYEEKKQHYPYYIRLSRIDFADFNKIYDSDLLKIVGKTFLPF